VRFVTTRGPIAICATVAILSAGCTFVLDADAIGTSSTDAPGEFEMTTASTSTTMAQVTTTTTLVIELPPEGPVFGEETGVLLLLDDGLDGLTAIGLRS
jgi:hypothetical protein